MSKHTERVHLVLGRLRDIANDEDEAESISGHLEIMLDNLISEDFFGTEGECDPRGDFRDGAWSMSYVQGVDD